MVDAIKRLDGPARMGEQPMTVSATDSRQASRGQTDPSELQALCQQLATARAAGRKMAVVKTAAKNAWLERSAEALRHRSAEILEANAADVAAAPHLA